MMYLVFLAFLYKLQGGRFRSFVRAVLGHDVEADKTPTSHSSASDDRGVSKPLKPAVAGYVSDGAASDVSAPGEPEAAATGDKSRALAALGLSTSKGGGTFSGSYQRLPSWEGHDEERGGGGGSDGGDVPRSLSINSDGGGFGAGTRSLSVNSDAGATARSTGLGPAIKHAPGKTSRGLGASGGRGPGGHSWFLSAQDRQVLKRRTILARITPIVLLSSFVGDLDLITDWTFLKYGLAGQGFLITKLALFFAIVGTVMWALSTTEFSLMSKLKNMWKGNPLSRLQHVGLGWQLLANVFLEDVPQFIITVITRPTSVTGVLNLCASGLSLCAKIVHGISSQRAPSLSTQFKMIDQDPAVTRNLFKLRDEAKKKAKAAEKLVYLAWANRCSTGEPKAAAVFQVLQMDPTFVGGDLEYMRADLFSGSRLYITACSLTGPIPSQVGDMTILQAVVLSGNQLSGSIPAELGKLANLKELNLSENTLSGPIPVELTKLGALMVLNLSTNALTGPIPAGLSDLKLLTTIMLAKNRLTGEIPPELGGLPALQTLDLSQNMLTGPIPEELGEGLSNLQSMSVGCNKLTGSVPESLRGLSQLKSLVVANNMLTGAKEAEQDLKPDLHPECLTDFLPQEEPEEEEEPPEEVEGELQTDLIV